MCCLQIFRLRARAASQRAGRRLGGLPRGTKGLAPVPTVQHVTFDRAGALVFTIDYVTSRDSDEAVERVMFDGSIVEGAAASAEAILRDIMADAPRGAPPVIGYVIRDEAGTVVRRLYKGLG
jgi:hypothetical protein